MPPRLFRAIRLVPVLGDAMLRMVDAVYPPHALLMRRIRRGPLRDMVLEVDPRALDMVIGSYEPAIQSLIEATLRPGDVAFDVGSNLGYFTLLMATKVNPDGRVVAFEPDPEMFAALERNLERNSDAATAVTPLPVAAGAAQGKVRFARGWRATRGRVVASGGDLDVDVTTVDETSERYGSPRLLKIDVEGGELDVLRGARAVLSEARPLVLVEVHSIQLEAQCARFLESLDYECSRQVDIGKKEPYLLAV